MFETVDRVLTVLEHIVDHMLEIIQERFELLFIAVLYLSVALFLANRGHEESLDYWLIGSPLIGAIAMLVNRFSQSQYKALNGGNEPPAAPPAEIKNPLTKE